MRECFGVDESYSSERGIASRTQSHGGTTPVTNSEERREAQAELDAAAFHAYGLDRQQTAFVLDNFHRVQNPRVMDEAYFDMVLESYDGFGKRARSEQSR